MLAHLVIISKTTNLISLNVNRVYRWNLKLVDNSYLMTPYYGLETLLTEQALEMWKDQHQKKKLLNTSYLYIMRLIQSIIIIMRITL